ncbi:MAG: hypothetical protein AAGF11_45600 [Myxococcota bacterium]
MRRILPLSLCVATLSLTACDQAPVDGPPTTDDEQALHDFRASTFPDEIPGYEGNGDITLRRASSNGGGDGGVDIILWDVVGVTAKSSNGTVVQQYADETIIAPETGETMCTTTISSDGLFKELRDADGTVLFSSMGLWTFDGAPELEDKNIFQQYQELTGRLRFSFNSDDIVDGLPHSGDAMVTSSEPVQFASRWRKLVIASLVDGYCGSDGLDAGH